MDASVIIPSLNGKQNLERFLDSIIFSVKKSKYEIEIVIVDDHSADGSIEYLHRYKQTNNLNEILKIIDNKFGQGISSARNTGAKISEGKYLIFLDNDVLVEEDFFDKVLDYCVRYQDEIKCAACAGYYIKDMRQLDGMKLIRWKHGFMRFTSNIMNNELSPADSYYKSYGVQGAYFVCGKDLFDELGGFLEIYDPIIMEEADLSYRILKRGYTIGYIADVKPLHLWGGTINSKVSEKTKYLSIRNRYIFTLINIHSKKLLVQFLLLLPFRILCKFDRKAIITSYKLRKQIFKLRVKEKMKSKISDMDLLRDIKKYEKLIRLI